MPLPVSRYVYFMFSPEQRKLRTDIEKNIGKRYIPGRVLEGGKWREYTELSSTSKSRYPDSYIVAEGNINEMRYTQPSSI